MGWLEVDHRRRSAVGGLGAGAVLLAIERQLLEHRRRRGQLCRRLRHPAAGLWRARRGAVFAGLSIYLFATQTKESGEDRVRRADR